MRTPASRVLVLLLAMYAITAFGGAEAQELVFQEDFSGSLETHWTTGANSWLHPQGPTVTLEEGKVRWNQLYDYIETKPSFAGDFRIEVDVLASKGSGECADFVIELVETGSLSGMMRFQLGVSSTEAVNLGNAPTPDTSDLGDCWDAGAYPQVLKSMEPHAGTFSLTYKDRQIRASYKNDNGEKIETQWAAAGPISGARVRIWGSGAVGTERYVDNVRVYDLSTDRGYAANGIWKSVDGAVSFYLQKYEAGSCLVVVTTDGLFYTAFVDEDYSDGVSASNDLRGRGYTLDLSLRNATQGTLKATLPSGVAVKEVELQYGDTQ